MDNAAKVLIMAGGVLIALLVISVSMYMYTAFRSASETSSKIHLQYEIDKFNSYFNVYPTLIRGSDAYNILSKIDEINRDDNSLIYRIETTGDVTVNNYTSYFYFTEKLMDQFDFIYHFNGQGIINSVSIMKH